MVRQAMCSWSAISRLAKPWATRAAASHPRRVSGTIGVAGGTIAVRRFPPEAIRLREDVDGIRDESMGGDTSGVAGSSDPAEPLRQFYSNHQEDSVHKLMNDHGFLGNDCPSICCVAIQASATTADRAPLGQLQRLAATALCLVFRLVPCPRTKRSRNCSACRRCQIKRSGTDRLNEDACSLADVDELLKLTGRPMQPSGVPGQHCLDVARPHIYKELAVLRPERAGVRGEIVVDVDPGHRQA
jgi:hypothetical protein